MRQSFCVSLLAAAILASTGCTVGGDGLGQERGSGALPGEAPKPRENAMALGEPYLMRIHDRVYQNWDRPVSSHNPNHELSTIIKITIEKDGRISQVTLVKSSGDVLMDESAMKSARVAKIDPLPACIHEATYTVPIQFVFTKQ